MKNRIRFNQVNLLENNGIYIKKSNDGKTAIIFPGHGSQYVNMLSDLRGRNKIVDETLAEAENYYKGITGDSFLEHLMTSDINTVSEIMQPAIIIANEVFFRIAIQEFKVKPHILLGHSLGEISALLASGVISFKDAIKISYSRAKSLEYLDTSSQGLMLSLKLNNNKDEVLINTYLENHNNLELAIVNSKFQKVVSGAKESILRLEKYCQKVDIVAKILPVPYPFHSKLLRPIKHQYEKVIKDIEFNLPKIPVYSTILTRLYEDREVELTLTGEILLKSDNQLVMKVTLSSDFVNSKGVVLQKNIIHSSGIIEMNNLLTTESVERYRDMLGKYNSIQIKKHLNMDKYYLKGADNIFFGPNFRNISNVRVDNSKKISIGDINVTDESKVFNFINNIDSKINPILIDNVGRLMLLNEFYQNGNTVVPTFISKTISLESFNIGEKVKAYVEKVAENGDEVIYDAFVFNESKLLLIIEQMHLTKVGQTSDYEIEI